MHYDTLRPYRVQARDHVVTPAPRSHTSHYYQYHPEKTIQLVRVREVQSYSPQPPPPKQWVQAQYIGEPAKQDGVTTSSFVCEQKLCQVFTSGPLHVLVYNDIRPVMVLLPVFVKEQQEQHETSVTATTTVISFSKVFVLSNR